MPKFPSGRGGKRRPTGARIDHRGTGRKANGDLRGSKPAPKKRNWFTAPPTRSTRVDKKLFRPAPKRAARPAPKRKGSLGGPGVNASLFNQRFVKPIMLDYARKEQAFQRKKVIKALTVKPTRIPKYVRAPKIAPADQIVVPLRADKQGRTIAGRVIARPRLAAPRMLDPLSKGAKREFAKNERAVVKRREAVVAKDLKVLLGGSKSVKTVDRSVQRLRDYGVLSGKSRSKLARSLAGEKDRQRRVAAERKRLAGTSRGSTPFERAVVKGAKTAFKIQSLDPSVIPGVDEIRKSGQTVKVAGFDLTAVDRALQTSRNKSTAAALLAVEQLTRISSGQGEALSGAIRAAKSGKGSLPGAYLKGFGRGFVDNKSGYSKPLQDVGVSRGAAAGVGFVADILLDPTTYVSFGAVGAAKAAVRGAGAAAARSAVKQGLGREAVRAATKRAMRAKAVELRRGSASVRDLGGKGESAAIAAQRRELARLEAAGKGSSKKAENSRRNVAPAGKRTESRIRKVERRTDVASKRADKVAGRVAPDRVVKRTVVQQPVKKSPSQTIDEIMAAGPPAAEKIAAQSRLASLKSRMLKIEKGPRKQTKKQIKQIETALDDAALSPQARQTLDRQLVKAKKDLNNIDGELDRLNNQWLDLSNSQVVVNGRYTYDQAKKILESRSASNKTIEVSVPGRVTVKPSRRTVTPIGPRFKQRKELRFANAEVRARFGGFAKDQAIKGSKRRTVVKDGKPVVERVGTPADELKGTVYSAGFGKRARVKLRTSGTGFKSGSGIPGAKGLRRGVSEFAPGVRRSAEVPALGAESARVASRQMRAGDNAARQAAKDVEQLLNRAGIRLEGDDTGTWAAIYERSGVDSKEPLRVLDDGSFVYGPKNDPVVVSDEFVKRYVDVDGARPVLKGAERVAQRLARDREGVVRSGQPVGDATKMRASAKDVAAKEGVSEAEAKAMLKKPKFKDPDFFAKTYFPSGKLRPDPFAAATYLDNAATKFYPRRQELNKKAQIRSDREALLKPTSRGNIESRVDPRPLDVGNAERAANPTSLEAQSKPLLSNDPNTDLAVYAKMMGQVKSLNNAVRILADSGTSVKFKPGETAEDFLRRYRIPFEGEAADGRKLYELSSRNGRYDLVEVETYGGALKKIVDNSENRQGQYVVLDNRNVAAFREARTSVVLSNNAPLRVYDQVSARIRRLAIFTPMYQAINEMGDTWIMFTVVPAYKIPYYKARALPVVRYIQGLESGKGADALVGKGRKGKVGLGSLGDVVMFENGVERTVKEVADELIAQGGARQGFLARSIDMSDPQTRAATQESKSRRLYRKVADSQMVAQGKMKIAPLNNVNPASVNRLAKSREDWSRTATYLYLRDEGYTPPDSVSKMLNALIDYGELSWTERNVARRLAFFYTFPARQIPYQTKALLERPGKLAAYEKLRVAAAEAQGVDLDELKDQPWYVQANVPIPVKIKGELYWVSGNLPFNMLNQTVPFGVNSGLKIIRNDALFAITSLNPVLRAPAEDAFDRNFFFRSTITKDYGDNLTPAPSWAVWLANAVPGFANEARLIKKPTKYSNGQDVWLMDNKWAWRFSQLAYGPLRLVGEAGKFRNQRGDTAAQRYGRFFTGIRTDSDKKKLEEARTRLYDKKDKLDQQVSTNKNSKRENTPANARLKARVKEITRLIDEVNVELGIDPEFGRKKSSGRSGGLGGGGLSSGGLSGGGLR